MSKIYHSTLKKSNRNDLEVTFYPFHLQKDYGCHMFCAIYTLLLVINNIFVIDKQ